MVKHPLMMKPDKVLPSHNSHIAEPAAIPNSAYKPGAHQVLHYESQKNPPMNMVQQKPMDNTFSAKKFADGSQKNPGSQKQQRAILMQDFMHDAPVSKGLPQDPNASAIMTNSQQQPQVFIKPAHGQKADELRDQIFFHLVIKGATPQKAGAFTQQQLLNI